MNAAGHSIVAALLGQGVKPSLTPAMHEREAARHGLRYVYKTVDLNDSQLAREHLRDLLRFAVELGFDGLNVTHPIKRAMVPLVDRVAPEVQAMGALNTVVIRDGTTVAHNTDVTGFTRAFQDGLPAADLDVVLLLGAGGAGTAVAHALVRLGVSRLLVADVRPGQAEELARAVGAASDADVTALPPSEVAGALTGCAGLVNATPVGMAGHPGTPVDPRLLHPGLWVADIVYRPLVTPLLRAAGERGCRTLTGAGMAVHQAADAFRLITGLDAHREDLFHDFDEMVAAEREGAQGPS